MISLLNFANFRRSTLKPGLHSRILLVADEIFVHKKFGQNFLHLETPFYRYLLGQIIIRYDNFSDQVQKLEYDFVSLIFTGDTRNTCMKPDLHSCISLVAEEIFDNEKCSDIVCCGKEQLNDCRQITYISFSEKFIGSMYSPPQSRSVVHLKYSS